MTKILITGGSGFIGTNLTEELRNRGHDVWRCDITHSADPQSIRCDVGAYRQIERILEEINVDYVYHAAASMDDGMVKHTTRIYGEPMLWGQRIF